MENFIYNEMMVHVPVCTSKDPKNVLIISENASNLEKEMQKHNEISSTTISAGIESIRDEKDNSYDVVICEAKADAAIKEALGIK